MAGGWADWLFDSSGLTPHGFCLLWKPGLIWTYAVSDVGIGLAYFSIPVALGVIARRRRDLVFRPIFWLFAAFILLCGSTHWLDVLTLWVPAYGLQAAVKAATAVVSLVTAVGLWWLLPYALAMPSSDRLRAANAALAISEARHRANFERSPVPLYAVDGADVITAVSESWLTLLGYRAEEVIGRPIDDFRAASSERFTPERRATLMATGELLDQPRQFQCSDGGVIEAVVSARLDRQDDRISVICVLIDVTARRRAEAALRASEERLHQSQKMEAVGQLTGGIAHDFNNMLQGIVGCLDRMTTLIGRGRADEVPRYVLAARDSADRAATLTGRMLAFARRQPLHPSEVDPNRLAETLAELIRRTVGPAIALRLRLDEDAGLVLCDANQLESALLNLAINARDAMPEGGTLTVTTAQRRLSRAELAEQPDAEPGAFVEIAVTDTGAGMPAEVVSRVFEPFFTTKPIGQGTGLGLSQVYGFVTQSGGLVRVESSPGQGTTVRLCLKRHGARPDEAEGPGVGRRHDAEPGAPAHRRTVLLVDDEAGLRLLMAEALAEIGCRVLQAETGAAAIELVEATQAIDMLVTDIGLPGMNGRQLADVARRARPGLPVLLITGYAGAALTNAPCGPGLEIMNKPFRLDMLCARVAAMLEARRLSGALA